MKEDGTVDMENTVIASSKTCKSGLLAMLIARYDFLTLTLPSSSETTDLTHLLPYYTSLPFPLFKRVVESSALPFKDKQAQFGFAKKAIAQRKKKAMAQGGMEEAAVLAFKGEEGGMVVEITRKSKKGRPALWKVEQ